MERSESGGRGRVVLATVKGDVHDIGKNLVDIILTNNGYEVHNLGIKVAVNDLLQAAEDVGADAIGMSGLLVKSTLIMRENLEEMNRRGLDKIPVLLGGAALTRSYVERDLREVYNGRLFYGKDAFEGLRVLERLMELRDGDEDDPEYGRVPAGNVLPPRRFLASRGQEAPAVRSPTVANDNPLFVPPFYGTRVAKGIALDEIASYINETALFRNQWGYRPENGENDVEFKTRVRAELRGRLDAAKAEDVLVPQVVWGYFHANSDGNDLVIWGDADRRSELTRFSLPRQPAEPNLCISDFFRPVTSDENDVAALFLVTMGRRASDRAREIFAEDRYVDYVALHGLSVEMTEALAELWHRRIREELGYEKEDGPTLTGLFRQKYRGGRYSFGYPACPSLEDNEKVVELLGADRIDVEMSEGFQLEPEQTTLAIVCHHPQAKYFVV
jgi:5-methyltetrahydrofolate--homocysteine methyltransferase